MTIAGKKKIRELEDITVEMFELKYAEKQLYFILLCYSMSLYHILLILTDFKLFHYCYICYDDL